MFKDFKNNLNKSDDAVVKWSSRLIFTTTIEIFKHVYSSEVFYLSFQL